MLFSKQEIVYIQHTDNSRIVIRIPSDKKSELKTSWLLEGAIAKLKTTFPDITDFDDIVTLQTVDADYVVDYWLAMPNNNLSILKDRTVLKPFYKQVTRLRSGTGQSECKITLQNFNLEAKLERGAFSNVYLGSLIICNALV